ALHRAARPALLAAGAVAPPGRARPAGQEERRGAVRLLVRPARREPGAAAAPRRRAWRRRAGGRVVKILGIDHVGVCVSDVGAAAAAWLGVLPLVAGAREVVAAQRTEAAFLLTGDEAGACLELIAPAGENTGLEKFLAKRGGGLHHLAFRVDDLAAALA